MSLDNEMCPICGIRKRASRGTKRKERRLTCDPCRGRGNGGKNRTLSKYKKSYCEACGFIATNPCQLDVDHIDGNKHNNNISNYQTLCANCHRLKTYLNKDWESNK